jgi:hypothetical protein
MESDPLFLGEIGLGVSILVFSTNQTYSHANSVDAGAVVTLPLFTIDRGCGAISIDNPVIPWTTSRFRTIHIL